MVSTQTLMFLYMFTGVIAAKTGIIKKEARPTLISLLLNVTVPCMVFNSFQQNVTAEQLKNAVWALVISTGCCLGGWLIGHLLWRKRAAARRPILEFSALLSNQGYAGMPVVSLVFGPEGVFYTSFILIPVRIFIWTIGISLFQKGEKRAWWKTLLMTPSLIAVFVGLLFLLSPLRLPDVASTAVSNLGAITGPLSMIIIGSSLAEAHPRDILDREVAEVCFVRLLLLPVLTMIVLRALGVSELLWQVETVLMAMPAATNCAIFAERYGQDRIFGAKCVFMSTALSLFTVPLVALLF